MEDGPRTVRARSLWWRARFVQARTLTLLLALGWPAALLCAIGWWRTNKQAWTLAEQCEDALALSDSWKGRAQDARQKAREFEDLADAYQQSAANWEVAALIWQAVAMKPRHADMDMGQALN